jgi:hypothetical protein
LKILLPAAVWLPSFGPPTLHRNGGGDQVASSRDEMRSNRKQTFAGWMLYNWFWFKKNQYAIPIGRGAMSNPGPYLTLLKTNYLLRHWNKAIQESGEMRNRSHTSPFPAEHQT